MLKKVLSNRFKDIDLFEAPLSISIKSICGACTSLVIWILVAVYAVHRFTVVKNYGDTVFNDHTVKHELSDDEFNQDELGF